jgi:Arc/MetJ-type ribon-helix-helix transcriptional regulator
LHRNEPVREKAKFGMVIGMATQKLTITLQEEQLKEIRGLIAAGQAPNVSSFVQHAVGVALNDAAGWQQMLDAAMAQTGGPLTDGERAWADAILDSRHPKKKSRPGKAA